MIGWPVAPELAESIAGEPGIRPKSCAAASSQRGSPWMPWLSLPAVPATNCESVGYEVEPQISMVPGALRYTRS